MGCHLAKHALSTLCFDELLLEVVGRLSDFLGDHGMLISRIKQVFHVLIHLYPLCGRVIFKIKLAETCFASQGVLFNHFGLNLGFETLDNNGQAARKPI